MSKLYDDELSEGFLEIADNMKKYGGIELKDDNTDKGGVAFKGETLQDFLDDLADENLETLDDVNNILKDNGIQPIEEDLDDEVEFEEYMGTTTWDKSRDRKGWETYNGKEDVGEIDAYIEYDDNKQKILVTITKYVSKNEDGTLKSEETTKEFTDVEEAINWANEKIGKTKIQESLDTNNKIYKMAQELGKFLADKGLTLDVSIYILGKRFHIKDDGTLEYDIDANPRDYFNYVRTPNILSMSFEGGLYDVLNYEDIDFLNPFFSKYGLFFELGNTWNGSVYTIDDKDDYEWDKIIYNQDDVITENLNNKDGDNKKMGINNSIKNESIDTKELLKYQQEPREVEEKAREVVDPAYAKASDDINQANDKKEEIVTMEEIPTTEDRFKKPSVNQKGAREMKLTLNESLFEEVDDKEIEKETDSIRKIMRKQGMEPQKSKEDYVKVLKKIHEIRDKNKSLKESKSNILSYHEFVDYLDSIDNGYTGISKVKNNKGVGYRYNLKNKLTREQHSYLEQYDNVFFGEAQYKYAPEIKYDTVILLDRMNKIEESKDSTEDMSYDVGYDHYGSKYMAHFNGPAYIEYDGGAGNIQWLVRGQNHRYYWENSAGISEPYIFDDYDSALKVQIKYGGEIVPYWKNTNRSKIEESKEPRYTAREVNGKGYIYDKKFSNKVPSNVDKDIETARKSVDRWNKEEINEGMKTFLNNLGKDEIQYFTHKNRFNYDIKQVRVDNKNKTYKLGQFRIVDRLNSTQNGAEFRRLIDELKNRGYKEISKFEETLEEDIEKTSKGKWVNKGKEGTHGEFKTKKAAREQQKAMYAKGFKGESLEENDDVDLPTEVTYDFYTLVDDDVDIDSDDYNLDDEIADRLSDDYGTDFLDFDYDIDKKSGDVYVYNIKWDPNENLKRAKKEIKESNNSLHKRTSRGLSDDEIKSKKNNLYSKYRNKEKPYNLKKYWEEEDREEMEELDFRDWVNSCLIYDDTETLKPEELKHSDTLKIYRIDFDRALEIIEEQKERFKNAKVNYNVHTDEEGVSYNSVDWDLKENVGQDVAEYQKWVDYDMKRYGKISEKTNRKVRDAGLKIVKDIYGDYEVIANEPIRENKKINEAKEEDNPIKDIRTNVLEFENGGDYIDLYIDYKDGKLIAGMTTNAGIIPEYQIEYDDEKSVDENLQDLYDEIISKHPEYLETVEEKNKNS